MSVTIDPANLAKAVARRPFGYLITVSPNGEPHLRAVVFVSEGNALVAAVGKRSADNVADIFTKPLPKTPFLVLRKQLMGF